MPEPIWIDDQAQAEEHARLARAGDRIGIDTEFLRERTYYPRLCLLQIADGRHIYCIDALAVSLAAFVPVLVAASTPKIVHAARQDVEALHRATGRIVAPIHDTQIAAACAGMRPQIGYAELVQTLLGASIDKSHTRTDWSKRPLSREQIVYAADDVRYLGEIAELLDERLRQLGRQHWVSEDCAALAEPSLYQVDPEAAWERLGGILRLAPAARSRARLVAAWRERTAQRRDRPRSWILPDAALYEIAQANPADATALVRLPSMPPRFDAALAAELLASLHDSDAVDVEAIDSLRGARPSETERAAIDRMLRVLDARAAELGVSAEVLATRGQIRALATGARAVAALAGWRRGVIGERLLSVLE